MALLRIVTSLWLLVVTGASEWKLIWEDNFDTLDSAKWDHEIQAWGGGNSEFQFYSDDKNNSYVRDGILYILPTPTVNNTNPLTGEPFGEEFLVNGTLNVTAMYGRCTNNENSGCYKEGPDIPPVMSGRLRTAGRFSYKFGKAEIYAKMPVGDWLWPAIWMLPEDWIYGPWPASGEIDIIESIGNPDLISAADNRSLGIDKMGSTLHWGPVWNDNKFNLTHANKYNSTHNFGETFHLFTFEWDKNSLCFSVDGEMILERPDPPINKNPSWTGFWDFGKPWKEGNYTNPWENGTAIAPFDKRFHFLLNVAVGGTNGYIKDNVINRGGASPKPWNNTDNQRDALVKFWAARDSWYPTWAGEQAAMQVDWIRVYQLEEEMQTTGIPTSQSTQSPVTGPVDSSSRTCVTPLLLAFLVIMTTSTSNL